MQDKIRITESDFEVLELVKQGLSNAQIAEKIHKSDKTVKNRLYNMYTRFGIHNRVQLVFIPMDSFYVSSSRNDVMHRGLSGKVKALVDQDMKPQQIAIRLQVSSSAVYYHLKKLKKV